MRIEFDDWLTLQKISPTAEGLFKESVVCYKASAYRAALLLSYVGLQTIIKDRLLSANCPSSIPAEKWNSILKNLIDDDKWDFQVYEATQMKPPISIFGISDDLRNQITYWRNRRNDCAHSKQNEINFPHAETFWLFIKSNLAKLVVNGSKEGLVNAIRKHFDYSMTPRGADCTPIVEQIPTAISTIELMDFFREVYKIFHSIEDPFLTATKPQLDFWSKTLSLQDTIVVNKLVEFLKTQEWLIEDILREFPEKIHFFSDDPAFIRKLWYSNLFIGNNSPQDIIVFCGLLRNNLIPANQLSEAFNQVILRLDDPQLSEDCFEILKSNGFFAQFKQKAFIDLAIDDFKWGNKKSLFVVYYLSKFPIDDEVALSIQKIFDSRYNPRILNTDLHRFFSKNESKKTEFAESLARLAINPPEYLRVFDSQKNETDVDNNDSSNEPFPDSTPF